MLCLWHRPSWRIPSGPQGPPCRGSWSHFAASHIPTMPRIQFSSVPQACPTLCDSMDCSRPPYPLPTPGACSNSCHPTISSSVVPFSSRLQSFPKSGSFQMSQFVKSGGQSIGSFSFSISPSNEYSGLISFRIDWLDLLAVQGTLKSLLQNHSSKASILRRSAFFIVQLKHSVMRRLR